MLLSAVKSRGLGEKAGLYSHSNYRSMLATRALLTTMEAAKPPDQARLKQIYYDKGKGKLIRRMVARAAGIASRMPPVSESDIQHTITMDIAKQDTDATMKTGISDYY